MEKETPKILKIVPYRGPNEEITEGRKTKISLYSDRLEYSIKYTQKVKLTKDSDNSEVVDSFSYNEEDGFIIKDDIHGIVKYIETDYTENLEPYIVNFVDIMSTNNSIKFSMETSEDKDKLYLELYQWKFNKI
jgi:hypothetical protein